MTITRPTTFEEWMDKFPPAPTQETVSMTPEQWLAHHLKRWDEVQTQWQKEEAMTTRTYTPEEETRRELFMTAIAAAEKLASALDDLGIYNSIREGWKNYLLLESGLDSDHLGLEFPVRPKKHPLDGWNGWTPEGFLKEPDTLTNRVRRLDGREGEED